VFIAVQIFQKPSMLEDDQYPYTVCDRAALNFYMELLKKEHAALKPMSIVEKMDRLVSFVRSVYLSLDFEKAESFIDLVPNRESPDLAAAFYFSIVKSGNYWIQVTRFYDSYILFSKVSSAELELPSLDDSNWRIPCESLPKVVLTKGVKISEIPKRLTVRLKLFKKQSIERMCVEVVSDTVLETFSIANTRNYDPVTLAAFALYDVAKTYHTSYSHLVIKTWADLDLNSETLPSLALDYFRLAVTLFPVYKIIQSKVTMNKSKIQTTKRILNSTYAELSSAVQVKALNTNLPFTVTRHAILRYIERVVISEKRYPNFAFNEIRTLMESFKWFKADSEYCREHQLQVESGSDCWVSHDSNYCMVAKKTAILTVLVKNFRTTLEEANVL
tara:strand:- start:214 stop:1377 length:1164 start_codon:yes stop_codon:yes gene_type:complete